MRRFKHMLTDGTSPLIKDGFSLGSLDNVKVISEEGETQTLSEYLVLISALAGRAAGAESDNRISALEEILDVPTVESDNKVSITIPNILTLTENLSLVKPSGSKWIARFYLSFINEASLAWEGESPFISGLAGNKKNVEVIKFSEGNFYVSIREI
ncbi:MAG: hypothetical protein M0P12_00950 [Paludibacteraceae bacterium]|jgi:hypothetical protein|nr:hypothetical protein [Paludibacteraceae bacterium]MCK9615183.1 hypothetical protein [Candidatus Omnitrophota bacterium]